MQARHGRVVIVLQEGLALRALEQLAVGGRFFQVGVNKSPGLAARIRRPGRPQTFGDLRRFAAFLFQKLQRSSALLAKDDSAPPISCAPLQMRVPMSAMPPQIADAFSPKAATKSRPAVAMPSPSA